MQSLAVGLGNEKQTLHVIRDRRIIAEFQQRQSTEDRRQRRAQLVADDGYELVSQFVHLPLFGYVGDLSDQMIWIAFAVMNKSNA